MAKKPLKSELEATVRKQELRIGTLEKRVRELEGKHSLSRRRIRSLKSVARHYQSQRDAINGYLSGILDLVVDREEVEVLDNATYPAQVRKERQFPSMMRPESSEPEEFRVDPWGSKTTDDTHWQDY
jgi:DNA repair exonuclease SbcCD ATPase subunit